MAKNNIQPGDVITITATAVAVAGRGYLAGQLFGIAAADAEIGEKVDLHMSGVWRLDKGTLDPFTVGQPVFYDTVNGVCHSHNEPGDSNSAGLSTVGPIGVAVEASGVGATTLKVRLGHVPALV